MVDSYQSLAMHRKDSCSSVELDDLLSEGHKVRLLNYIWIFVIFVILWILFFFQWCLSCLYVFKLFHCAQTYFQPIVFFNFCFTSSLSWKSIWLHSIWFFLPLLYIRLLLTSVNNCTWFFSLLNRNHQKIFP